MEIEQKKRSVLKTITWRIIASLDTFIIAWVITGDWKIGGSIAGIEVITKMFKHINITLDPPWRILSFNAIPSLSNQKNINHQELATSLELTTPFLT